MSNADSINAPGASYRQQPGIYGQSPQGAQPAYIRVMANFFSWIFHPLLITAYVMFFLIFLHPYVFAGMEPKFKVFRIIHIVLLTVFFPVFSVFIMVKLKLFTSSMYLRGAKERIIPYVITMIFYWWSWNVFKNLADSPPVTVHFLFGTFLAICGAWMCNIYFKISMHAVAMGGLVVFFILFSFQDNYASGLYISVAMLIAGIVCTSRFIVSDHTPFQIYAGLVTGMLAQFIAWQF
jgi:hypothetical protein